MTFKFNKKHTILFAIDSLLFLSVYLFSTFLEVITGGSTNIYELFDQAFGYNLNFLIFYAFIFISRYIAKVYRNVWKYADSMAYLELVFADAIGGAVALTVTRCIPKAIAGGWHNVATIAMFNCASLAIRFAYQQYKRKLRR